MRFEGYGIPLIAVEDACVKSVLDQSCIIEWIAAGKQETEIIEEDEIAI
jgi:hypothetical protein